jgi:hypothetical protein
MQADRSYTFHSWGNGIRMCRPDGKGTDFKLGKHSATIAMIAVTKLLADGEPVQLMDFGIRDIFRAMYDGAVTAAKVRRVA